MYPIVSPIWIIYTFSIKYRHSYLDIFPILKSTMSHYRLPIAGHYRPLCIKSIFLSISFSIKAL